MPILELPPNPSRLTDRSQESDKPGEPNAAGARTPPSSPIKVRTGRYGELEEHELIHLLDSLDDERSKARFRESIYISVIVYLAIAWFLFYGPHILFHQPYYQDPIAAMKQHDREITLTMPPHPPVMKAAPKIDRKTLQQLQKEARQAPPTPQPPAPQPAPQPQEQAHNTAPPVAQPPLPLPAAPKPQPSIDAPLPAAPRPSIAQNTPSAGDAIQNALRGGRSGADVGAPGSAAPLQAGATILSDTQGVDFSAYMRRLHNDIQRNWDPLIPQEVEPPLLKKGIVGIRFIILPDGRIGNIILESRSGDVALDHAAWNAITSEGQFPPLPREFHGPQLELRVGFFYNTPISQ
jgi:TonB family protein